MVCETWLKYVSGTEYSGVSFIIEGVKSIEYWMPHLSNMWAHLALVFPSGWIGVCFGGRRGCVSGGCVDGLWNDETPSTAAARSGATVRRNGGVGGDTGGARRRPRTRGTRGWRAAGRRAASVCHVQAARHVRHARDVMVWSLTQPTFVGSLQGSFPQKHDQCLRHLFLTVY